MFYAAAAWARYYAVVRVSGGKGEELSRLAVQVLISALAVPVGHVSEEDEVKGRTVHLTALLGLTKTPMRASLLKEAVSIPASIFGSRSMIPSLSSCLVMSSSLLRKS